MTVLRVMLLIALTGLTGACVTTGDVDRKPKGSPEEAAQINYELGAEYLRQGNLRLARQRLERSVELNPDLAAARSALALVYDRQGDTELADRQYRTAVRLAPDDASVQNTYAVFLCNRQRYEEAVEYFGRAAGNSQYATPEAALTNAGVCLLQKPEEARAEVFFRRALQKNPTYSEALLQMASLSVAAGNHMRGRAFVQRYLGQHPATPEILLIGLRAERALGDEDAAERYAGRLRKEFPGSAETLQLIGDSDER